MVAQQTTPRQPCAEAGSYTTSGPVLLAHVRTAFDAITAGLLGPVERLVRGLKQRGGLRRNMIDLPRYRNLHEAVGKCRTNPQASPRGISDLSARCRDVRRWVVGRDSPQAFARYGILDALSEVAVVHGQAIDGPGGANFE
jgi:hypothetical protein